MFVIYCRYRNMITTVLVAGSGTSVALTCMASGYWSSAAYTQSYADRWAEFPTSEVTTN